MTSLCVSLMLLLLSGFSAAYASDKYVFERAHGHNIHYSENGWLRAYNDKQQAKDHFFVDVDIEGSRYQFIIDTGASALFLPLAVAKSLKLPCKPQVSYTASSTIRSCTAILPSIDVSGITVNNVQVIYPLKASAHSEVMPLLGMDVLSRLQIKFYNQALFLKPGSNTLYSSWLINCIKSPHKTCPDPIVEAQSNDRR